MEGLIAWLLSFTVQEISAFVVLIGALMTLSARVRAAVKKGWLKLFPTRTYLKKHIEEEEVLLNSILKELKPNDSTSLRDAIDRIEDKQTGLEAFLSAQLNVHTLAIVRTDVEGKLIYVNRHYQRMLGVAAHEVTGDGWINVIHPSERDKIYKLWHQAVENQREFNEDITFVRSDGREMFGHANVYKEIDSKGRLRGYLGVITFPSESCDYQRSCLEQMIELVGEGYEIDTKLGKMEDS